MTALELRYIFDQKVPFFRQILKLINFKVKENNSTQYNQDSPLKWLVKVEFYKTKLCVFFFWPRLQLVSILVSIYISEVPQFVCCSATPHRLCFRLGQCLCL